LSLVNKIEIFDFKKKRKVLAVVNSSNSTVDRKKYFDEVEEVKTIFSYNI